MFSSFSIKISFSVLLHFTFAVYCNTSTAASVVLVQIKFVSWAKSLVAKRTVSKSCFFRSTVKIARRRRNKTIRMIRIHGWLNLITFNYRKAEAQSVEKQRRKKSSLFLYKKKKNEDKIRTFSFSKECFCDIKYLGVSSLYLRTYVLR